jgi:hypothetical protein
MSSSISKSMPKSTLTPPAPTPPSSQLQTVPNMNPSPTHGLMSTFVHGMAWGAGTQTMRHIVDGLALTNATHKPTPVPVPGPEHKEDNPDSIWDKYTACMRHATDSKTMESECMPLLEAFKTSHSVCKDVKKTD